jgi:hypothetical protein
MPRILCVFFPPVAYVTAINAVELSAVKHGSVVISARCDQGDVLKVTPGDCETGAPTKQFLGQGVSSCVMRIHTK